MGSFLVCRNWSQTRCDAIFEPALDGSRDIGQHHECTLDATPVATRTLSCKCQYDQFAISEPSTQGAPLEVAKRRELQLPRASLVALAFPAQSQENPYHRCL